LSNRELQYRLRRKKRTKGLGESIDNFFKKNRLQGQFTEASIQSGWKEIAGVLVANHTKSIQLKYNKIILKVDSAPLRNELLMQKKVLIKNINDYLKEDLVKEIVFI